MASSDMDDLLGSLQSSFQVEETVGYSSNAQHPRYAEYKNVGRAERNQVKRRGELLDAQKQRRFDAVMHARCLALDVADDDDVSMTTVTDQKPARHHPRQSRYRDRLMLSEWLVDIPEKLTDEWLMVPCPEGKRTLLVSAKGVTTAYSKSGFKMNQFPSDLPGGNRHNASQSKEKSYTLLDCVYSEIDRCFYVLDLMCWNGNQFYDSETDFRFFWLGAKFGETPSLREKSKSNAYPLITLPYASCTEPEMTEFMQQQDFHFISAKLDGLLFYHKAAHYEEGRTPLVGWLKPFMLPEILNVPVPAAFTHGETLDSAQFIRQFNEQYALKKGVEVPTKKDETTTVDLEIDVESKE